MTVLRRIRAAPPPAHAPPRVLGVDDWCWRKGQRYGTLLVDLEQQRPIDLLPDRTAETLAHWLRSHPEVEIISRDRAGAYAEGARQGAPHARQVADRFHLVKNMGETLERLLSRHHASLRAAASPAPTDQCTADAPTQEARPRRGRHASARQLRWQQRYDTIQTLHRQGQSIHGIARTLGLARNTVRCYLRAPAVPVANLRPARASLLDPFTPYLEERWHQGCHNATQLWREIRRRGFTGGRSIVRAYVAAWRDGTPPARHRRWSARHTM